MEVKNQGEDNSRVLALIDKPRHASHAKSKILENLLKQCPRKGLKSCFLNFLLVHSKKLTDLNFLNYYSLKFEYLWQCYEKNSLRQQAIVELISEKLVTDQNKIVDLLKEKYFIETNQAIVSRDLRKLGIIKKIVNGVMTYENSKLDTQVEMIKSALLDIVYNEVMIVIRTNPGLAAFVGDHLDKYTDLNILGCLAGENVVFVAPKTISKIPIIYEEICKILQFKKI